MTTVQRLTLPFENLYVTTVTGGAAEHRPVFGVATIGYDGRGSWWLDALRCHSRHFGRPDIDVAQGGPFWRAVAAGLEADRGDEIAAAINTDLAAGTHMALFDEHLPREELRRGPPPHVSFGRRRAPSALARAAEHVAAFLGLVLVAGSLLALGSLAPDSWPRHQHTPALAFAMDGGRQ